MLSFLFCLDFKNFKSEKLPRNDIFEEVYVAALPNCHRLTRQKQIALASLADEPLIFYPRSLAPVLYSYTSSNSDRMATK
jgi:hypothetical protein